MPEGDSDVVCHLRRVSRARRGQSPVHSMLLPTGGRIAAASWGGASRGAAPPPTDVLSSSYGSKPVLCGLIALGHGPPCPGAGFVRWWEVVSCVLFQGCSFNEVRAAQVGCERSLALL